MSQCYLPFRNGNRMLKNGTIHAHSDIEKAVEALNKLKEKNANVLFELVKQCRFDAQSLSPIAKEILNNYEILYHDQVREVVKDVVLSAISGRTLADLLINCPLDTGKPAILLWPE